MKKIEAISINKKEYPAQFANIVFQCKSTHPSTDAIHKIKTEDIERIEVNIIKKETNQ